MTIIILEGADGAGKTTLAKELQRISGLDIVKGSSFEISQLGQDEMYEHMNELLDRKDIIVDRFYMSNRVYGELYDYPTMRSMQFANLADKTEEKRALTVYVTADIDELRARLVSRGDRDIKPDELVSILEKYQESLNYSLTMQSAVLTINTTFADVKKSAPMVLELAKMQERKMFSAYDI
jgi:thymidylate kinase